MFKRKLFKQALPIILSVAMTVQSMPATALAAENPAVEETVLDESTDTGSTSESTGNEQESDAQPAENADASDSGTDAPETANEVVSSSDAGQAASEVPSSTDEQSADKETATKVSETETAGAEASKSETTETKASETETAATEASETETTGAKASETETAATEASETDTAGTNVSETETAATETSETGVPVTETAASEIETEDAVEFAAENEEQTTLVAKIIVDDKVIDDWLVKDDTTFWRKLNEKDLIFITTYNETSQCATLQKMIADSISIEVDGEENNNLKDKLTYSWVKKADNGGEGTKLVDELPKDVGEYELTVSLSPEKVDGLYNKLEGDLKVSLTIEKADVELNFEVDSEDENDPNKISLLKEVTPGTTVEDLIEKINENYTIEYKKGNGYSVSRDILAEKKLPLSIFALDGSGKLPEEAMKPEDKFEQKKDYVLKVGEIALTENAKKNYNLSVKASYLLGVGELQKTQIKFTREDAGKDLIKLYDGKAWTIDEATTGIFVEEKDSSGEITKTGAPKVLIADKNGEFNTVLEDVTPEAKWYTRIRVDGNYNPDDEAGEIQTEEDKINYVYKPMDSDPKDAGEYYIIWSYAGDDIAYKKAISDAVRFTIDPVPAVIKIDTDKDSEGKENIKGANFRDGMDSADIRKELANISYKVYPFVKNAETGALEESTSEITPTPEFFGTSYRGDAKDDTAQYYVPEFILQRRVAKITEKGGTATDVDENAVDWEEVEDSIDVVVEEEDAIKELKNELPIDVEVENLESVEFEYRIYFTGYKVLYDTNGNKDRRVEITDVTTSAANRNYLVDVKKETLEKNAVLIPIEGMKTEEVQIVVDDIVKAFIEENKDVLEPQVGDDEASRAEHQGTLEKPAVKIYNQKALFNDRASYKQATVYKIGENGKAGDKVSSSTDEALTYTWYYAKLDEYDSYLEKYDEEQRKYTNFEDYVSKNPFDGWIGKTNPEDGTLDSFTRAGVYRLLVEYNDPEHMYKSAKAEVIFKVEQQEVIIVPAEQYVKVGDSIDNFAGGYENKKDFTIYKLPHNSIEEFEKLTDDEKRAYELPTEKEIATYEEANGKKPSMQLDDVEWKVLRKAKNPETGEDTEEWVEATGEFEDDFTYGVAVNWTGSIDWLVSGKNNYTTQDIKLKRTTGETKHHESVSAVKFYDQQIYVEVDADKIKALGHEYDGTVPDLAKVAEALTFYTDEALTEDSKLNSSAIVNTTEEYDPAKINIYWMKYDEDGIGYKYANKNAVYGGTYTLMLRFEGGELKTTADTPAAQDGETVVPTYAPFENGGWHKPLNRANDDEEYTFTVTPHEITITPKTISESSIIAGETADELLAREIGVEGILEGDQKYFDYTEIAAGSFDITWDGKNADGTDKEGFVYKYEIDKNGGYPAFDGAADYIIQVDGKEIKNPESEHLRYDSNYTIKLRNKLASPLKESYRVQYGTAEVKVAKRGNARVEKTNDSELSANGIKYDVSDNAYTIRPLGAVKFYNDNEEKTVLGRDNDAAKEKKVKLKNTNILGFRIYVPQEFLNDFDENKKNIVYQNAVWNEGGYFLGSTDWRNGRYYDEDNGWIASHYIDVVFPLTKEDSKKSFNITWEEGYTETFTLADVVLEEDLTKAVAPKSIKFNGVTSKMAVGETQQLDLKITKAQLGDVINIRYRIKDREETKNDYISLDPETGVVTALKAGKTATVIEAYPVYKDAKGDFVPVKDSKGREAKAASTKITVTDVTASAVKKVVAQDKEAKLYFTVPDNGYRREIYVVDVSKDSEYADRKKWKKTDFDQAIAGIKNGQWESAGFAIEPIYSWAKNENLDTKEKNRKYDKKLKAHIVDLENLEAGHDYVVYVRNVSATRVLDDGSVVALSTNGAVKKFKTTKSQVEELMLDFTIKTGDNDKKNTVTWGEYGNVNDDGKKESGYIVELSSKKAQLNVYGLFSDKEGGNDAAENEDKRKYSLIPTIKEERAALKKYQLPKLQFAIFDKKPYNNKGNLVPFDPSRQQSKYASINNKGLISLKGVDLNGEKTVYIYVRDSLQYTGAKEYGCDAYIKLTITAKPASVTGKKANMKVGQSIMLSDYLQYKDAKKKKIANYRSGAVTISEEMIAAANASGYKIEDAGSRGDFITHDWKITAVSPNKAGFNLDVTDYDADGNAMSATVKLKSVQIDAVKGLKVTYVDDKNITINFTHASNKIVDYSNDEEGEVYKYALEVKDARGNVVEKIILSNPHLVSNIDGINAKELKSVQSWIQYDGTYVDEASKAIKVEGNKKDVFNYYTGLKAKTKTFAYTYSNEKLVRLSSYTLSVTPLYENQKAAKAATVKTKTTNIPASYNNVDLKYKSNTEKLGGNKIYLTKVNNNVQKFDTNGLTSEKITTPGRVISGNTYTLRLDLNGPNANKVSKDRVSDKLTWKSSNKKVATVKANAGTYTATFKALNQGKTVISVTSKVTKKVIARWTVTVSAVKDGSSYGGDYEPTWDNGFYENILALYDPDYAGRLEVLSENVPLVIKNDASTSTSTWISFTAPHYGKYTLVLDRLSIDKNSFYDSKNDDGKVITNGNDLFLEANQKIYFKVKVKENKKTGTLKMTGTELARLTKNHTKETPLEVKEGYVSFTAWEDNVYTFWLNGSKVEEANGKLKAGKTEYIRVKNAGKMYVTYPDLSAVVLTLDSKPEGTVKLDKDNQTQYISFTANITGEYAFTYKEVEGVDISLTTADGEKLSERESRANENQAANDKEVTEAYKLEEGEKVVIVVKADPEITDAAKTYSVTVKVSNLDSKKKIENNKAMIQKGTTEIVEYVIPAFSTEKAQFNFSVKDVDGKTNDAVIEKIYDADYNELVENRITTLIVPCTKGNADGIKCETKAGSSIYIKVTAGGADDENAKDTVLAVEPVPVEVFTKAPASKTIDVTNDTKQWYTFTAPEDGYYEFGVTVDERAENDKTPTHKGTKINIYSALFGSKCVDNGSNITTTILPMKTDEMVAVELVPDSVNDIIKDDGTKEKVKSSVTVAVNALDIQKLEVDSAATVKIDAGKNETRYYSFTAAIEDDYAITWEPDDAKTDNSRKQIIFDLEKLDDSSSIRDWKDGSFDLGATLSVGKTVFIKIDNTNTDFPVSGNLTVKAEKRTAEELKLDEEKTFSLDEKTKQKVFKFTAAEEDNYAIIMTVGTDTASGLEYMYPEVEGTKKNVDKIEDNYYSVSLNKGETNYFTLSLAGGSKETKGIITIISLAKPLPEAGAEISVADGVKETYTYVIPESGRYELTADYDKEKATVEWSEPNGTFFLKNTKISVSITGKDEKAAATVKLSKPAKIKPITLKAGENAITVEAGKTKYYELSTVEPVTYSFEVPISGIAAGKAGINITYDKDDENRYYYYYDYENNVWVKKWYNLPKNLSLEKNSSLFIIVESDSETRDADCKLNIVANTELKLGNNTVKLGAGESANLTFRAKEDGYYNFYANKEKAELVLKTTIWDKDAEEETPNVEIGDSFHDNILFDFYKLSAKRTRDYTLTNEGSTEVELTIVMKAVDPIEIVPGNKAENIAIASGENAYFTLKTFKEAQYGIKVTDTSKGEDLKAGLNTKWYWNNGLSTNTEKDISVAKVTDGFYIDAALSDEALFVVRNDGLQETKATIELTKSEEQRLTEEAASFTLKKNQSQLISFVATADNRYCITIDNDKVKMNLDEDATTPITSDKEKIEGAPAKVEPYGYADVVLKKGDKLVYKLSYNVSAAEDKKADEEQKVTVQIAPVKTTPYELALTDKETEIETTPVDEKSVKTVWYHLTAKDAATYTFSLEDAYKNKVDGALAFYSYMAEADKEPQNVAERYMKANSKVFMKVTYPEDAGDYTLKYTAIKSVTGTGSETLTFEYAGEQQEVKFVVPKGGEYKIYANSIRGNFAIKAIGTIKYDSDSDGKITTDFLRQNDIITVTVTSLNSSKASATLRFEAVSVAEELKVVKPNEEGVPGTSSVEKDIYHEMIVTEDGLYAIMVSGDPVIYYVPDSVADNTRSANNGEEIKGTKYVYLKKDARILLKVKKALNKVSESAYAVKVIKVPDDGTSLDGKNTEEKPFEITSDIDSMYYSFTTKEAYIEFKVPENSEYKGQYYYAIERVYDKTDDEANKVASWEITNDGSPIVKDTDTDYANGMVKTIANGKSLLFKLVNSKSERAVVKLTVRKVTAHEKALTLDTVEKNLIAAKEEISYKFKATEAGKYIISFEGAVGCELKAENSTTSDIVEVNVPERLDKDGELTITINNSSPTKEGNYILKVSKFAPTELKLDTTMSGSVASGKTVYYVFNSTAGNDPVEYLVYLNKVNDDSEQLTYSFVQEDKDGKADGTTSSDTSTKVTLAKDEKLFFTLTGKESADNKNVGFKLTVKAVNYAPITAADTAVSGTLEGNEKAYYEFTATETEATKYNVSLDKTYGDSKIESIYKASMGTDNKLGKFDTPVSVDNDISLKSGEKLRIVVGNTSANKKAEFKLTVEKAEKAVTYDAIGENDTKKGKLAIDATVGYELTAANAAEKKDGGSTYTVYFKGNGVTADAVPITKNDEDKEIIGETISIDTGSREIILNKNDKLRITLSRENSGTGEYELTTSKTAYESLTLGTTVSKTLNKNEKAYYQYTASDAAAKYYVTCDGVTKELVKITKNGDGTTTPPDTSPSNPCELKAGDILQIKLTGASDKESKYKLSIEKVTYIELTAGQTKEERLEDGKVAFYQFTSTDEKPTEYQVYGNVVYDVNDATVKDGVTTPSVTSSEQQQAYTRSLQAGEALQFTVKRPKNTSTDSGFYTLTIANNAPKALNTNGTTNTGKLVYGQSVSYTYKYEGENEAFYTVSYPETKGATIKVDCDGIPVSDIDKISLTKGQTLKVTVTAKKWEEVADVEFTVGSFKPIQLSLNTLTDPQLISDNEKVFYEYTVPENGAGDYVVSEVKSSNASGVSFSYAVNDTEKPIAQPSLGIVDFTLKAGDVLKCTISKSGSDSAKSSVRLMLQKKPDTETALTENSNKISLKSGEVKWFKFTVPAAEKEKNTAYIVSISGEGLLYKKDSSSSWNSLDKTDTEKNPICTETLLDDYVLCVANTSMDTNPVEGEIVVQKKEPLAMGVQKGTLAPNQSKYFVFPSAIADVLGEDNKPTGEKTGAQYYISSKEGTYVIERKEGSSWKNDINGQMCDALNHEYASDVYIVRVRNTSDKACNFEFTLKAAWKDEIKAASKNSYDLEKNEKAYFKITAPKEKALYVSISSRDYSWAYVVSEEGNSYRYINLDMPYVIAAEKTCYFRVDNSNSEGYSQSFTLHVTDTPISLQLGTASTAYIPSGETALYTFDVTADGKYMVVVNEDIRDANPQYTYVIGDSEEEKEFKDGEVLELKANAKLSLKIKNQESLENYSRLCRVEIVDIGNVIPVNLGKEKAIQFDTYGDVYYLAVPVKDGGDYIISGMINSMEWSYFVVECLNNGGLMYPYGYQGKNYSMNLYDMQADDTIYIKVYPYSANSDNATEPYERSIIITATKDTNKDF